MQLTDIAGKQDLYSPKIQTQTIHPQKICSPPGGSQKKQKGMLCLSYFVISSNVG